MLELSNAFYFFLTKPVLANDTRYIHYIVFKKLYKYYKFIGQKSSMYSDFRFCWATICPDALQSGVWIQQCLQLGLLAINCKEKRQDLLF